ncbi:hypothetical protein [Acidiferrobacter thiooxydans]|uniref:Uncharacterized protein n=1 Tax=Acidiferrobacter thiooxydans TaxID=163359 RepID=A0A1C2FYE7_9GAMM|nr:hypothetical protein [Acidiferrobacter thiooxydans]MDA8190778.1 hypothetical protein [Gammaproteobacteria bacterium]RCN56078.1 hypothetical protein C4900_09375 [Acidiferrobacter thiooxydans]UEN98638.1 hypothetical protein A9R16_009360 [Acidiferrobacter thiooxydans]
MRSREVPRAGPFKDLSGARRSDYWLEVLFFFVVEDDIPFIDDMPLDEEPLAAGAVGAADPPVVEELLLGLVVVPAPVLDDELAGLAVVDEALLLAALWQPASAKRTADARINFFIMISGTLGV